MTRKQIQHLEEANPDLARDTNINVGKSMLGMIPIVGTAIDAYDFYKEPTLENAGWLGLSLASDILPALKPMKALKTAKNVTKAAQLAEIADRRRKLTKLEEARENVIKLQNQARRSNINPEKIEKAKRRRGTAYRDALLAETVTTHNNRVRTENEWFKKYLLPSVALNTTSSIGQGVYNQYSINNKYK